MARKKAGKELIFSLDIGTRTVVGIVGKMIEDKFTILDYEVVPHSKRSMLDGQIEDIDEVSKVVAKVKNSLEERSKLRFSNVAIAAAGRSLKTERVLVKIDIPTKEPISEELAQSFEMEAISTAQKRIDDKQKTAEDLAYYCVGYSIIGYKLDGYSMKAIKGHRGNEVEVEVVAAFLPSMVVESLYSVMDKNKLEVTSLTLEPIAAMNVIVPAEVRLINIALVDIGAGTSDIAISQNGSIVAYAMATIAGDEITEEIIKHYLVDFETAEEMKLMASSGTVTYKDILGLDYTIQAKDFYNTIMPSIDALAQSITNTIVDINGSAPAAVFLVGGGSLIPSLPQVISEKLNIPLSRIAVSGSNYIKSVAVLNEELTSPEFVTPIGIGITSLSDKGYNFSNIFLNDKKFKVFDTNNLKVIDVLLMGGYKTKEILGRSGADLKFILNQKEMLYKGEIGSPAILTLNEKPTTLNTFVKKWDKVEITPAITGKQPIVRIIDTLKDIKTISVFLDGKEYKFNPMAIVNNESKPLDYKIMNDDVVEIIKEFSALDLFEVAGIDFNENKLYKDGLELSKDYKLENNDILTSFLEEISQIEEIEKEEIIFPIKVQKEEVTPVKMGTRAIQIILNGKPVILPQKEDFHPHQLLEVLNHIEFDTDNKKAVESMSINGKTADFISTINDRDYVEIKFTS